MAQLTGISASVGRGGGNRSGDVMHVQQLLNAKFAQWGQGAMPLVVDGKVGPKTIGAIEAYQRKVLSFTNPDGRVDPDGKTIKSLLGIGAAKAQVAVAIHGWVGKTPTRGFRLCAETAAHESGGGKSIVRHTSTKQSFLDLCKELAASNEIVQFHVYSHSGRDGPIFSDGQFMPSELEAGVLPAMTWAAGAQANFYGCNAGLAPWSVSFATSQKVTVRGSAGYSLFSQQRNKFYPFDGDPDRTPCYLDCFPGMNDLLYQKYGFSRPDSFLEDLWRKATLLPSWREARNKHYPPRPMVVLAPS